METKQYSAAVLTTESKPETIRFGTIGTHAVLGLIYQTGEMVDVAKKAMFYGKPFDRFKFAEDAATLSDLAMTLRQSALDGDLDNPADIKAFDSLPPHLAGLDLNNSLNRRLLHVVMGTSSESSEIANELRLAWEEKRPVDRVNMSEELGDHFWYLAVGADELNIPLSVIFQQNITKLTDKKAGRYREGAFDMNAAINRDLETERATLESSMSKPSDELISTDNRHVYYDRNARNFVWFDEAGLEGGRANSYDYAVTSLNAYAAGLSGPSFFQPKQPCPCGTCCEPERVIGSFQTDPIGPHHVPTIVHQAQGSNAGEISLTEAEKLSNNPAGGTLERFSAAAKGVANGALDLVASGVDKGKTILNRQ